MHCESMHMVKGICLLVVASFSLLIPNTAPAEDLDLSKDSAAVRKHRRAMSSRSQELKSYFVMGHIGIDKDGMLTVRSLRDVPPMIAQEIRNRVSAENRSRKALVEEIGRANGVSDDDQKKLKAQLARDFRKKAGGSWWVQRDDGKWKKGAIR